MQHQLYDLVIVGGGPTALYVLKHLAFSNEKTLPKCIAIFERESRLGPGMPYSGEWNGKEHYANIAAGEIPDLIDPAAEWFQSSLDNKYIDSYYIPTRIELGNYLETQFTDLINRLNLNIAIQTYTHSEVVDIVPDAGQHFTIHARGKNSAFEVRGRAVIVTTGHSWKDKCDTRSEGMFSSPWPISKLASPKHKSVAVIGQSLSAIDTAISIAELNGNFVRDYHGVLQYEAHESEEKCRVCMHSRRGLLPSARFHFEYSRISIHQYMTESAVKNLIRDRGGILILDELFEIVFRENLRQLAPDLFIATCGYGIEEFVDYIIRERSAYDPFDLLEREFLISMSSIYSKRPIPWKELLDDFCYMVSFYARFLSAGDRDRFANVIYPLMQLIVGYLPPVTIEKLLALHRADVLSSVRLGGRYEIGRTSDNDFDIKIYSSDGAVLSSSKFDVVVDCRGQQNMAVAEFDFKSLLQAGALTSVEGYAASEMTMSAQSLLPARNNGPSVNIDHEFRPIDVNGMPACGLWILSHPYLNDLYPYGSGLPFCNLQAEIVTRSALNFFSQGRAVENDNIYT